MDRMTREDAADAFSSLPSFGTGGIRKPEGIGPNRINTITIRWATAALAASLPKNSFGKILIGYDTRHNSQKYAEDTALTLNGFGIDAVLFETPVPVPLLSFSLRNGNYLGGIMITASHNGPKDNGFKVYDARGGQLMPTEATILEHHIKEIDPFAIRPISKEEAIQRGLLCFTGKAEKAAYLSALTRYRLINSELSVVATPLHGSGYELLPMALKRSGHDTVIVAEQTTPDGDFPTIAAPNPEDDTVFDFAKIHGDLCKADLLLATDGDADRCGCCVRQYNEYIVLCGNEIAAVLIYYLTDRERNRLPQDGYVVRTSVSGTIAASIAKDAGLKIRITPTGFKHIGALINDDTNGTFFAGYEESGGFLCGTHTADKDGIATAVLLSEAAAHYKQQGKTLVDILEEIGKKFGREYTSTERFTFEGKNAEKRKQACLQYFRVTDFPNIKKTLWGNTIFFDFGMGIKTALRPSGTEPCLKLYRIIQAKNPRDAARKNKRIDEWLIPQIKEY